jgi:hypothetical protein
VGNIFAPNYRNGITEGIYILIFPGILKNEIDLPEKDRRWWDTFKGDQRSLEVKKQWWKAKK